MGTITFQVTETGFSNLTKTYTLPDGHVDRLVAAYQNEGNAAVGGTATRAQVLNTWANILMKETVGYVANWEQQAALAAVTQVPTITPV